MFLIVNKLYNITKMNKFNKIYKFNKLNKIYNKYNKYSKKIVLPETKNKHSKKMMNMNGGNMNQDYVNDTKANKANKANKATKTSNTNYLEKQDGKYVYKYYNKNDDSTIMKDPSRCMCINYSSVNDFNTYDRCNNKIINNTNFCQLHQDCKSYLRKFLSGSEDNPDEHIWKDPLIEGSHNCYSYFLNRQVKAVKEKCDEICHNQYKDIDDCLNVNEGCGDLKPQPGDYSLIQRSGTDKTKKRDYQCSVIEKRILQDNPSIFPVAFNNKCPAGHYKGAMVVEPQSTYHFYKQLNNGLFYHKPGLNPIAKLDSPFKGEKGRPIYIPHFANRDYSKKIDPKINNDDDGIKYTSFCSYYCIPQNNIAHKNLA